MIKYFYKIEFNIITKPAESILKTCNTFKLSYLKCVYGYYKNIDSWSILESHNYK